MTTVSDILGPAPKRTAAKGSATVPTVSDILGPTHGEVSHPPSYDVSGYGAGVPGVKEIGSPALVNTGNTLADAFNSGRATVDEAGTYVNQLLTGLGGMAASAAENNSPIPWVRHEATKADDALREHAYHLMLQQQSNERLGVQAEQRSPTAAFLGSLPPSLAAFPAQILQSDTQAYMHSKAGGESTPEAVAKAIGTAELGAAPVAFMGPEAGGFASRLITPAVANAVSSEATAKLNNEPSPSPQDLAKSSILMSLFSMLGIGHDMRANAPPEAPVTPVAAPKETPAPRVAPNLDALAKLDALQGTKAPVKPPEPPPVEQTPEPAPKVAPQENVPQVVHENPVQQAKEPTYETPTPEEQQAGYKAIQIVPDRLGAVQRVGIKADGSTELLNQQQVAAEDQKAEAQPEAPQSANKVEGPVPEQQPAQESAPNEPQAPVAKENQEPDAQQPLFSKSVPEEDKRDLIAQHNISAEGVKHADKIGGLAVPSVAVTHVDHPLTGFGEISLLGQHDLINPRSGAKVFGADAYSPRHPSATLQVKPAQAEEVNRILDPFRRKGDSFPTFYGRSSDEPVKELMRQEAFKRFLAKDKGITRSKQSYPVLRQQAEDLLEQVGAEPKIFQGFTYSGNRRYKPYNLDNAVREMKKELRGGESGTNMFGAGQVRASVTPQFRSIRQIRAERGRLVSKEDFEKVRDEVNDQLSELASKVQHTEKPGHNQFIDHGRAVDVIGEAARLGVRRALAEYGYDKVPEDTQAEIRTFLDKLRNLPTEYFEAILPRAVGLHEFHTAVVPHNADRAAVDVLRGHGLKIRRYKGGNEEDRARVIKSAASERAGTLFSKDKASGSETPHRTPQDVIDELRSSGKTGHQLADLAGKNGLVEVHPNMVTADLNIHPSMIDQAHLAGGVYSPRLDKIKLMSENIPKGNALGVGLHEITHARLKDLMGENEYNRAISDLIDLADKGDPTAKAAMDRIPENTPAKARGDELLAYTVQEAVDRGAKNVHGRIRQIVTRLMNALRARIAGTKFYKAAAARGVRLKITPEALAAYARRAVDIEHGKRDMSNKIDASRNEGKPASELFSMNEDHTKIVERAKAALDRGASVEAVHAILKESGVDPSALGDHGRGAQSEAVDAKPVTPTKASDDEIAKLAHESIPERVAREKRELTQAIRKVFPAKKSESSKLTMAAQTMARAIGNRRELTLTRGAYKIAQAFDGMSEAQQINWIRRYEAGDRSMPHAAEVQKVLDGLHQEETGSGASVGYLKNYLPHRYKDPKAYEQFAKNEAIKGGKGAFQKERTIPTLAEAIEYGLKPRTTNVGDMLMDRIHESVVVKTRLDTLKTLENYGEIRPYDSETELAPGEKVWHTADYGSYVVPEDAQDLLNNGVFSNSTWDSKSLTARAFRHFMAVKNALVISRLGASLFHFTHMLLIRPASAFANTYRAYFDAPVTERSAQDFATSFFKNMVLGHSMPDVRIKKLWDVMHGKEVKDLTANEKVALQYMMEGGFRASNPREYRAGAIDGLRRALSKRRADKFALNLPLAVVRSAQIPIMDWFVPALKMADFLNGAHDLAKIHADFDVNTKKRATLLNELRKNNDERFGELAYDNLFWDKKLTNTMQAVFLSFSWQYGFIKQFGGGALDLAKATRAIRGKAGDKLITSRAAYALSYFTLAFVSNGLLQWARTGTWPSSMYEYINPVSRIDPDGKKHHVTTPAFTRELTAAYFHIRDQGPLHGLAHEAVNKMSPALSLISEMWNNKDYWGYDIVDPDASLGAKAAEAIKGVANDLLPISVQSSQRPGTTFADKVLAFSGYNPAPAYQSRSFAQAEIVEAIDRYEQTGHTLREEAEREARGEIRNEMRAKDYGSAKRLLAQYSKQFGWTRRQQHNAVSNIDTPKYALGFRGLPSHIKLKIFRDMTEKERETYAPYLGRPTINRAKPDERKAVIKALEKSRG